MDQRWLRYIAGVLWLAALVSLFVWFFEGNHTLREVMSLTYRHVVNNPIAPVIYILIYTLRPLTFFPAMWLTLAAGSLFGFLPGLIYALIGENLSANTAYGLARFFRSDRLTPTGDLVRVRTFKRVLREHAFPTVVVLRASYLPFDLVNYACGLLRVAWPAYAGASLIGMLPPMVTFVSFGATVRLPKLLKNPDFSPESLIDATQLEISAGLLVASAVIALWAHRRRRRLATES
ncbi:VTT domain-containing protein [Salinisphaera sp. USBA-960]|uniref:TVP38/TMEM64 family protein n=1 Tax=Salinisphaera orenii TaxID=856731 RepID=UPI000DBE9437|nr:VTT domain-containing protein [Salifodinibacter halophilus]NNC25442.1 VTT domain-containing protein [Salifodinibacter halophilus]